MNPGVLGIDDNTIAYVSGHNIVILNVESKQYKYIQGKSKIRESLSRTANWLRIFL